MIKAFFKAPGGVVSIVMMALLLGVAIIAPNVLHHQATVLNIPIADLGPRASHLLGTNDLGQDIFARILVATRLSLILALEATGLGLIIGIPIGAGATMLPRRLRGIVLRAIDALIVFPGILVAIIVGAIVTNGRSGAVIGVGIASSFAFMRVASTLTMSVSGRDYVAAARVAGIRGPRLLFRYVLPNIADTLAITMTVVISGSIVQVSALSYLGLGVKSPDFDWGALLTDGLKNFYSAPAAALGTVGAVAISSITFGFAGEALARALNPLLWARQRSGDAPTVLPPTVIDQSATAAMEHGDDAPVSIKGEPVLEVSDLRVSFPGAKGSIKIVDDVSFIVERGELLGIVGESGSGKSMMAMAIANLVQFPGKVEGSVTLQGTPLSKIPPKQLAKLLGTNLAVVFQDPLVSLNPALRVGTQLTEGTLTHTKATRREASALAVSRLQEVMIPAPERQVHRHPHELSGGMRQRVVIAMALMNEPALLIADEPTTALDVTAQAQIMDLIVRINREHDTAVILISHNLGLVSQNCSRVLVMYAGRIVEELTAEQLVSGPLHPYTNALVAAIPETSHPDHPLASIPGQVPDFAAMPTGCPYHPRCPLAMDTCRALDPPLRRAPDGRRVACWVAFEGVHVTGLT
ncbi:MAG TPA: dipeptide/oligopeptide/nickel ABC transporter permease/ATP-binding protein [Ilumatobacteraceae bacterium]